ncbi:hypothetical protein JCM11672_28540 [Alkaliphilus crotonatoxidans]
MALNNPAIELNEEILVIEKFDNTIVYKNSPIYKEFCNIFKALTPYHR